jgi:hypothetical protein
MRLDKMTADQRVRFDAYTARQRAAPPQLGTLTCMFCQKFLANLSDASFRQKMASVVAVPFFGSFCSQACANSFEHDYGILFKRDATGQVSYG